MSDMPNPEFDEDIDNDWVDPDDWDDDDELFLEELTELDNRSFINNFTTNRTGNTPDFDYDYERDDHPYGYGVD